MKALDLVQGHLTGWEPVSLVDRVEPLRHRLKALHFRSLHAPGWRASLVLAQHVDHDVVDHRRKALAAPPLWLRQELELLDAPGLVLRPLAGQWRDRSRPGMGRPHVSPAGLGGLGDSPAIGSTHCRHLTSYTTA